MQALWELLPYSRARDGKEATLPFASSWDSQVRHTCSSSSCDMNKVATECYDSRAGTHPAERKTITRPVWDRVGVHNR